MTVGLQSGSCTVRARTEERGRAHHIGGGSNKQGNLLKRLVLGECKMSRSLHPPPES